MSTIKTLYEWEYEKAFQTGFRIGLQIGLALGEEKWRRAILREQLEERFGPISAPVDERLQRLSLPELILLGKAVLRAQSLGELGFDKDTSKE